MSIKKGKVAGMIGDFQGRGIDPHYAGYFEYFNLGQYYQAHEVLEQLWLAGRGSPNHGFYKGLIQLAGAFVHLQKNRPSPAAALLELARKNLAPYGPRHQRLDVQGLLARIEDWQRKLKERRAGENPFDCAAGPQLVLGDAD